MRLRHENRLGNLPPRPTLWTAAMLAMQAIGFSAGCDSTPAAPQRIDINSSGGFDPERALSVIDTDPYYAHFFSFAYFAATEDELAYVVLTDVPAEHVKGRTSSGDGATVHFRDGSEFSFEVDGFPAAEVEAGLFRIAGDAYQLSKGRLFLVDFMDGADRVQQVRIPTRITDPEEVLRTALDENEPFRQFLLQQLREGLDSVELRGDAALMLYKTGLAAELPHQELRERLDDDNAWVRIAAASGLWEATQDSQAIDVLARIAGSDDVHRWTREVAAREVRRIAPDHASAAHSEPARKSQPAREQTSGGSAAQQAADPDKYEPE